MSISMSSLAASPARTCTWPARGTAVDATPPPSSPAGVAGAGAAEGSCAACGFAWGSSRRLWPPFPAPPGGWGPSRAPRPTRQAAGR
eukprot:5762451-Pyramimonas_sp.AAC.1